MLTRYKILLVVITTLTLTWYIVTVKKSSRGQVNEIVHITRSWMPDSPISCYRAENTETIEPLSLDEPPKGKSIFFHETSCKSYQKGALVINNRQACAVESAARLNPNFQVFLLYISPGGFPKEGTPSYRYLKALQSYANIKIRYVNYGNYVDGTRVEAVYQGGFLEKSDFPVSHASDVIRFLTLWRFGGIYLDLDTMVIKSLEKLPLNYAGLESNIYIGSLLLSFAPDGKGHEWATECLRDLQYHYDGTRWPYNGPGVITRFFERLCNANNLTEAYSMNNGSCQGYRVYPTEYFAPVHWSKWKMYFDENSVEQVKTLAKNSYTLHMWNNLSKNATASVKSKAPYVNFARQFCPKVFAECDEVF